MVKNELTEKAPFLSLPLAKNAAIFNKKNSILHASTTDEAIIFDDKHSLLFNNKIRLLIVKEGENWKIFNFIRNTQQLFRIAISSS